ncbi:MAG: polyamine aminopropyltransferase [Spirochaetota bacterium]|nr:polyamine aminopropyltransferase [Spirochaetota bacterium]
MSKPSQGVMIKLLLFSTFVVSVCGLSYELLIGSLSTNLLGNPVLQYSLTIGFFMSALGIGSYLSRFFVKRLLQQFIVIEIILGLVGGLSIALLNLVFIELNSVYMISSIIMLLLVGIFVGLEIPIITRILKEYGDLKETISNVLTIDYIGGLAASLIFPLLLYPYVGLIKTAFIIGFLNVLIGIINLVVFSGTMEKREKLGMWVASSVGLVILAAGIVFSSKLTGFYSREIYAAQYPRQLYGSVLYNKRSRFQHIVLTRYRGTTQLLLDGHLQFSSSHEYRYHEALVFPAFYLKKDIKKVLVMGGGDGLGVRQLVKFPSVEKIVLVDLDPQMTSLARNFSVMREINGDALRDSRVEVVNMDAYKYLGTTAHEFDVIYADFPDPHDAVISKLYSKEFYHFVKRRLTRDGVFITQATSPLHATKVFRCIGKTMQTVFKSVTPFHINAPSMGDWGFYIAYDKEASTETAIRQSDTISSYKRNGAIRFFTKGVFLNSLIFPPDTQVTAESIRVNQFAEPIIFQYYLDSWKDF